MPASGPSILKRVVIRTLGERERALVEPETREFVNLKQQIATTQDRVRRMLALLVPEMLEDTSINFDVDKMEFYRMVPPTPPAPPSSETPVAEQPVAEPSETPPFADAKTDEHVAE